jgi:hypothetical protein
MTDKETGAHTTGDDHMGAVEGDTVSDKQQGNENAAALDEDVLGANTDGSEGG